MLIKYQLQETQDIYDKLDDNLYQYGVDEYIWWEDHNTRIVTDDPDVAKDVEKVLALMGLRYTKTEE